MTGTATFDARRLYRYRLTRTWDRTRPTVTWVMLNPSTATASTDDNTIRRVVEFSRRWGYGTTHVVNLFALRSSRPAALLTAEDPVGPDNDAAIAEALSSSEESVVAWGNHGTIPNPRSGVARCQEIVGLIDSPVSCLGVTKRNQPRHPLYLPAHTDPVPYI